MKISSRSDIQPFRVMDLLERANSYAAQGRDIIHMEAGQPGMAAPLAVRRAAQQAIEQGQVGYTEALGLPALRQRIARFYLETYGVDIPASRVVVTNGSSGAFVLAFLALFETGARVGLTAPYYPAYPNILKALGYQPIIVPSGAQTNYQPRVHLIEGAGTHLDGFLIASPANPTGAMLHERDFEELIQYCAESRIVLISDEIYHGITYERKASTSLQFTTDAIVVNSFSKYFCMTGWRIGWLIVPEELVRPLERLTQNLYISTHAVSQVAALAAFEASEELDQNVAVYAKNRAHLLDQLPKVGLTDIAPADGAFYLYVNIAHLTSDSDGFCKQMLDDIGVATTPGLDFDTGERTAYMRLCYAGKPEDVKQAMVRIGNWLVDKWGA